MKKTSRTFVAFVATLLVSAALFAEIKIQEPNAGATVSLLTDSQKAYIMLPLEERRVKFADKQFRSKEMGLPAEQLPGEKKPREAYWPKTVRLAWESADGLEYHVQVVDSKKKEVVFDQTVKGGEVYVDNLEIAAAYDWSVVGGDDSAKSSFKTEDLAPRLVRYPGVPNVRDLGGRIGLDGRRVRQGKVIRSAGLNNNASMAYYTVEELKANGTYETEKAKADAIFARLTQLRKWRSDPASIDPEDSEYKEWCTRHPNDSAEKFIKSRIDRDRNKVTDKGEPKIEKGRQAGKSRVEGENGAYILKRFGIKSDIDLRSAGECGDMTGSPLGESVTWFHYSSAQYHGMQIKDGKTAFANVFKVFLDEKNYPIDFHCIAGQDRTGAVAFILNALLGVKEDDLYLDWELTGFWNRSNNFRHEALFDKLVEGFKKHYPAPTLRESCEQYVRDLGFTDDDIAKFREIMLEK